MRIEAKGENAASKNGGGRRKVKVSIFEREFTLDKWCKVKWDFGQNEREGNPQKLFRQTAGWGNR